MVDNYVIYTKMLGKGAFGEVYLGLNKKTRSLVAVKTELKLPNKNKVLMHEHSILKDIKGSVSSMSSMSSVSSMSRVSDFSELFYWEDSNKCYMVSPLYGPSLDHMHKLCNEKFTMKTCIMIGVQLLDAISLLHAKGILHRDIKPANVLVEYKLPHIKLNLIDFGLSKKCIKDKCHIPFRENAPRVGSLRYMSKHTHRSAESSYRDDIVSIGYLIVYLFVGSLPWKSVAKELTLVEKHRKVLQVKNKISNERLCHKLICNECAANCTCSFKDAMCKYFDYADSLTFGQVPDYAFLVNLIKTCTVNHNISLDYNWDWAKFYQ